ncbi:MAG: DNA primase [Verrucomicrobia bacterium]|nr:DNA primase [Verrucomicrobiota bacterium]
MAKLISKQQLEDIRFRNDIVEVVGTYITLKRAGGAFKALCPFHKEKTPSFTVTPQRQIFHCFGCGAGGDVFGFVMQHEGVDFGMAARMLAERAGIHLELEEGAGGEAGDKAALYKIHTGVAAFYQRCLDEMKSAAHARAYLETRALSAEIVKDFLIGYAPERWDAILQWAEKNGFTDAQLELAGLLVRSERTDARHARYDRFRNRMMFPIRDEQGRVIGFSGRALDDQTQPAKYINSPETPLFKKSRVLYAIDRARKSIVDAGEAIVCEGQIDVIRCHEAGFTHAVAAQGTAFTDDHARIIKRYADSVVLVFDPDRAGQDAAVRAAGVFMQAGLAVRVAALPPKQDPDAFIRTQGKEAFGALIQKAVSVVDFQVGVLSTREDVRSEVGVMRISRAVLQTILQSPNAVLRARLTQEASARLGLPTSALLDDLRQLQSRERRAAAQSASVTEAGAEHGAIHEAVRPAVEVELCEHLCHVVNEPEVGELVRNYLPLKMFRDASCRRVADACLRAAESGEGLHSLLEADPDVDQVVLRLAAAVQSAPGKIRGAERGRADAVRDIILNLWRRELKSERENLERAEKQNPTSDGHARSKQLTIDLDALKTWENGLGIIEIEMQGAGGESSGA